MDIINLDLVLLGALTLAVVEVIKLPLKSKLGNFIPLIAVGIGIILAFILSLPFGWADTLITGLVIGLVSSGGYDNVQVFKKWIKK